MKIKRFEAASMSDALRMVKREFGEEAVILSAKSVKKSNGLMGSHRSKKVVVTAAIDTAVAPGKDSVNNQFHSNQYSQDKDAPEDDPTIERKYHFLKRFNPITRTGQQKLQSKFVRLVSQPKTDAGKTETIYQRFISQKVKPSIAKDFENKMVSLMTPELPRDEEWPSALSQVIQAKGIVAGARLADQAKRKVLVFIGPTGAGKTTLIAKLAAFHVREKHGRVIFLSIDDHKVAGRAELERYGRILGIPLVTAFEPDDVTHTLQKLEGTQLVFVDTPGLGADDVGQREHLRHMIAAMPDAEVHLVLNADTQESSMHRAIRFFEPIGLERLGFTRMDWAATAGGLINQAVDFNLPITYFSDTPKMTQPVKSMTANYLAELLLAVSGTARPGLDGNHFNATVHHKGSTEPKSSYYVANRNSDIFHKNECNSVQRINQDNMVVFRDPAEAMAQRFKPCRMCCNELLISKPIQRVAHQYASSR